MTHRVAAIVVLYEPGKEVIDNIKSYINYVDKIYLVDNSEKANYNIPTSIDGDWDDSKVQYEKVGENKGIAYALNKGMKYAIAEGFQWVLTMDQDSSFGNDLIAYYTEAINTLKHSDVAILTPRYLTDRNNLKEKKALYSEVYWSMQSANLINVSVYEKVGCFREEFFIDCVDYEYCLRCKKNGYKIICCNKAVLKHSPATTKVLKAVFVEVKYGVASPLRIYYQVRNAMVMFKEYRNIRSLQIVFIKFLKTLLLFDNKKSYFKAFKMAIDDCRNMKLGKREKM